MRIDGRAGRAAVPAERSRSAGAAAGANTVRGSSARVADPGTSRATGVASATELQSLRREYAAIRAEATKLAGAPGDIGQRAVFLWQIFHDSKGNNTFPLVALHGALWAKSYYARTGPIAELTSVRYFYSKAEREKRMAMLDTFMNGFLEANRSVFIDTYTNYWFSKRFGDEPGAAKVIDPELLNALNAVHDAARTGQPLTEPEKRAVFQTALLHEQESTVAPKLKALIDDFDCPILRRLAMKPWVRFAYFPKHQHFFFDDFSDKAERIRRALAAWDLAEKAGWPKVEETMRDYAIVPEAFFRDREGYANKLRGSLTKR